MTHEEAWIDVDWELDFASFEWMVHWRRVSTAIFRRTRHGTRGRIGPPT